MRRTTLVLTLAAVVGCATPEEAFVGDFLGSQDCAGRDVDTGEEFADSALPITIRIDRDADTGEAFIAGMQCVIPLDVRSTQTASLIETTCNVTFPDGTPAVATYVNGTLRLEGDELTFVYSMSVVTPTATLTVNYEMSGLRS